MNKTKTDRRSTPVDEQPDPEVLAFRQQFDDRSPLDQLVREGARKMLQEAINAEVDGFIEQHRDRTDGQGRRLVVKNGSLPAREILTGAGPIEVSQGRVRDNSPNSDDRVFQSLRWNCVISGEEDLLLGDAGLSILHLLVR